ncbi:hypothetical protein SBA7_960023 [Candidatus Sulfotelmatobacter sp. SbA7]|nr:hypothetical protein SBA7_960023 [Candidatus Sulfotelmatobacter sp. SbA7]
MPEVLVVRAEHLRFIGLAQYSGKGRRGDPTPMAFDADRVPSKRAVPEQENQP